MEDKNIDEYTIKDYEKYTEAVEKAKPYLDKVRKAQNFVGKREYQLKENMAFYQGNPYLLTQYQENRPWVIQMNTPYASMAIDTRVASLAASDYIGELQPLQPEDKETVKTLQSILEDEWDRTGVNPIIDKALLNAAIVRESYVHVIFDTEKKYGNRPGEIQVYLLDTPAVYIDPRARCYKDARYVIVAGRMSYEEAEETYPEMIKFLPKGTGIMPEQRGEIYIENDYTTEQEDVLTTYTIYEISRGKIYKKEIIETLLVEDKLLKGLKRFPIAQLRWKESSQSAYGMALMDDLLALQKAITSIESAITNTAVSYASPTIIMRKGSGINPQVVAKTIGAPGVVYVSDIPISEAMATLTPPKIDDKIVNLKQEFEMAINKISGVSNQFIGDIGTAGNTAQGANLAVERAKIVETNVLNNIRDFVEGLTRIFLDYITTAYSGEIISSRQDASLSGEFDFKSRFVPENAKDIEYSYSIDLNVKSQFSKDREKQQLLELYQMERQYDSPVKLINELDILSRYDLSNIRELEERYAMLSQQTDENKATTILNLLQTALQYQIPPEMLQAAVTEIVSGDKETPALDEVMAMIEANASAVNDATQASEEDLVSQGIAPEDLEQAKQIMQQQGQQPNMQNLGL